MKKRLICVSGLATPEDVSRIRQELKEAQKASEEEDQVVISLKNRKVNKIVIEL